MARGLSALFWGLPIALLTSAQTDVFAWIRPQSALVPILAHVLLLFGVFQLGGFQTRERVWMHAVDRAKLVGMTNLGLSPFLFFWNMAPDVPLFGIAVVFLMFSGLLFIYNINHMLQRLTAMLPDQTLREETLIFTRLNRQLLIVVIGVLILYIVLTTQRLLPGSLIQILIVLDQVRNMLVVFLVLLPLALTLTLIWKVKETVFNCVFTSNSLGSE